MLTKCLGNCDKFEQSDGSWSLENPEPDSKDTYYDAGWCPECFEIEMKKIEEMVI